MAWAKNGTPSTLTVAGDTINITDLTAKKFNQFLIHDFATGGAIAEETTLNNNTNSVYAFRYTSNGAADVTNVTQVMWNLNPASVASTVFFVLNFVSISGEEKLLIGHQINSNTAGAGNTPQRLEFVGKFVPSPNADVTRIDLTNTSAGSFDTGSNLSALGTN